MGYGGSTWDTAGTLTLGSDNTFAVADSTLDTDGVYDQGWWKFTAPTAYARITLTAASYGFLKVYTGATFAAKDEVDYLSTDGDPAQATFDPTPGVEYHVLMGRGQFDPPLVTYTITWAASPLTTSPWYNTLPDSELIVTEGDLRSENTNPDYAGPVLSRPEWMNDVIRSGAARVGDWQANETLSGEDVHGALSCCVAHAFAGDQGVQSWNAATTGTGGGSPVCVPLPAPYVTEANLEFPRDTVRVLTSYTSSPFSATQVALIAGPSWGTWHLVVRDNMPAWGALPDPELDPEDYGFPADARIEWEGESPDLLGVEMTDGQPLDSGTAPDHIPSTTWALNPRVAPSWDGGERDPWWMGPVTTPAGGDLPFLVWGYEDGDVVWYPVEDTAGWDGHDWTEDYPTSAADADFSNADAVAVAWPTDEPTDNDVDESRAAPLAVKYALRARRFRFVYEGTNTVPPRRIRQRSDGATHGAKRALGGGNTTQSGNRTLGNIL